MRLGERRTIISDGKCIAAELYGSTEVLERHRHRYEVDPSVGEALFFCFLFLCMVFDSQHNENVYSGRN